MTNARLSPSIALLCLALVANASGCGETNGGTAAGGTAAGGTAAGGTAAGGTGGNAGAGAEPTYAGVVLALVSESDAVKSSVARAIFTTGSRPSLGGCSQCCCGSLIRGLPIPVKLPDAGRITLKPAGEATAICTLVPDLFENDLGSFYGTTNLGWAWYPPLSIYAPVEPQPWAADTELEVLASGNEVAAFSGILRLGPDLTGVTPALGTSPIVVDHTQAFEISWTPQSGGDAIVMLEVPNGSGVCFCDAPDAAGRIVVEPGLLGPVTGDVSLARFTVSNVSGGNASIDLVGAVVKTGTIDVQ
jgi:hypothetical protein